MSAKRDLEKLVVQCSRQGLQTGRTSKGHWFVRCPDGTKQFTSGTPSDWMVPMNFRAKLRRHGVRI